jgi:hypothetical protein
MARLITRADELLEVGAYALMARRLMRQEQVGFFGEPLAGLQIMGMLETRAVDHERIIVLSAMEGVLPPSEAGSSFIPWDVRRSFALPLPSDTEAVAAYSFHRLLQRASDVMLIHHEQDDASGPSRYIEQLRHGTDGRSRTSWSMHVVDVAHAPRTPGEQGIRRSAGVIAAFRQRMLRGLSPTVITDHINCPLDAWYRHVLGLYAAPAAGQRLEADRMGRAVHGVLQHIYAPFIGSVIDPQALRSAPGALEERLADELQRADPGLEVDAGQPLLQLRMAAEAIRTYLANDARRIGRQRTELIALEQKLLAPIVIELPEGPTAIPVLGVIDRIERRDGRIHIIDYKTGRAQGLSIDLHALPTTAIRREHRYGVQMMVYGWLLLDHMPEETSVATRIVPLQTPSILETVPLSKADLGMIDRAHLPAIKDFLRTAIQNMLDPATSIVHDPQSPFCRYCAS